MRPVVLLIALSISTTADANRRQKARLSTAAEASNSAPRSGVADGGTLLDYVASPVATAGTSAEEQVPVRITEEDFVQTVSIHGRPDAGFYINPVATLDVDPLHLSRIDPADFDIPIVINDDVKRWMSYYTGRGRGYFTKWLERRGRYEVLMTTALTDAELPLDLSQGRIESLLLVLVALAVHGEKICRCHALTSLFHTRRQVAITADVRLLFLCG